MESEAGTTTLHIAIGGLCLLVRDEERSDGKKMLHVLFPKRIPGPAHEAALMVHPNFKADSIKSVVPLDGVMLRLPQQADGTITGETLFKSIADEKCFGGKPVSRELLDGDTLGEKLKARLTITAGGQGSGKNVGAVWNLGECRRTMGTWVHWEIPGLPGGEFDFTCGAETLRLRPQGGRIELIFLHEMSLPQTPLLISELPPSHNASASTSAAHFRAFYRLIGKPDNDPAPTHGKPSRTEGHEHPTEKSPGEKYGLDYTCIMATAPAQPGP